MNANPNPGAGFTPLGFAVLGSELVGATLAGVFADWLFHSLPWGTVIGTLLGLLVVLIHMAQMVRPRRSGPSE